MPHCKIYGRRSFLSEHKQEISDVVHDSCIAAFNIPKAGRFHWFFGLESEDVLVPDGRSTNYVFIEVLLFEGRTAEVKRRFYVELYAGWTAEMHQHVDDLEVVLIETPRRNWAIEGVPGDEFGHTSRKDV